MDGTLVDTEPYWIATEFAMAEKYGGTWSQAHAMELVGSDLIESGPLHPEHMGLDLSPGRSSRSCSTAWSQRSSRRCRGDPARSSCSRRLRAAGVRCGLVTMSYERFVAPILAHAAARDVLAWW